MARRFPYVASPGPLLKTIEHLRLSFPQQVIADTLRKLGVAPNNESYVINILRFLGVIDEEQNKVEEKAMAFLQHEDSSFASEFEAIVSEAYDELFKLHGDAAWDLETSRLIQFFRTTDNTSDIVGKRQASTFKSLASLAGHSELPSIRETKPKSPRKASENPTARQKASKKSEQKVVEKEQPNGRNIGLTVRVEVNLPADGSQETYDMIFRSIRENLINE